MPGPKFGFVKLLASSSSHCTKWADEQHRPAGFESRLVPDLPLLFIPSLIGLWAFDHVSSRVWWEAATNKRIHILFDKNYTPNIMPLIIFPHSHRLNRPTSNAWRRYCLPRSRGYLLEGPMSGNRTLRYTTQVEVQNVGLEKISATT